MGGSRNLLEGGHLFRFNLTRDRKAIDVDDPRLDDGVADNLTKWEITESETPALRAQLRRRDGHPDRPGR